MLDVAVERVSIGHIEMREGVADFVETQVAAFCDRPRASENVRSIFEYLVYRVMTLDVELAALELHPVRILDALAGLNADHHVLRVGVVFAEIMTVVGGDHRNPEFFFQPEEIGMDAVLHLQTLVLDLQKEIMFAEDVAILSRRGASSLILFFHEEFGDRALEAAGESNQTLRMIGKESLAYARFLVEAVQRSFRRDLDQVAIAFFIFSKNQEVVVGIAVRWSALDAVVIFLANVKLAADDGFDSGIPGGVNEMHRAKNIAVARHRHGGHVSVV